MKEKVIISHPTGNMNVRAAVRALYGAGMLDSFHTCVACFEGGVVDSMAALPGLGELRRRRFDAELRPYTHTYPLREMGRQAAMKLGLAWLTRHEAGTFCIDRVYESVDRHVARYVRRHGGQAVAVYAYEDCAAETFRAAKSRGAACLYDLPIGYWRAMHRMLDAERGRNPEWAVTLGGFGDSEEKLRRKDTELAMADRIFVASTFTKSTLEEYPGGLADVEVIPYGFPVVNVGRLYRPFSGRRIKALFVGGLSQRKGLSYLFDAAGEFRREIELTVVGRGDAARCPALSRALGSVRYIPSLPHAEVLRLMAASDVLVFPSLFEGFGLVVTEAMSQGTPVVTTERTCGPDIITHGRDGWIVPAGQSEPLKELFARFAASPDMLQKAGREAMATASRRPWVRYEEELREKLKVKD